eukprot:31228-Eustigmatos_ZCMA.PRE.1
MSLVPVCALAACSSGLTGGVTVGNLKAGRRMARGLTLFVLGSSASVLVGGFVSPPPAHRCTHLSMSSTRETSGNQAGGRASRADVLAGQAAAVLGLA